MYPSVNLLLYYCDTRCIPPLLSGRWQISRSFSVTHTHTYLIYHSHTFNLSPLLSGWWWQWFWLVHQSRNRRLASRLHVRIQSRRGSRSDLLDDHTHDTPSVCPPCFDYYPEFEIVANSDEIKQK